MKNFNDTIGNRTRDFPACSAVPQPTAPPRARGKVIVSLIRKYLKVVLYHNSLRKFLKTLNNYKPSEVLVNHTACTNCMPWRVSVSSDCAIDCAVASALLFRLHTIMMGVWSRS